MRELRRFRTIARTVVVVAWLSSLLWFMIFNVPVKYELREERAKKVTVVKMEHFWQPLWDTSNLKINDFEGWHYRGVDLQILAIILGFSTLTCGSLFGLLRPRRINPPKNEESSTKFD
jgi:hypothetical protein